MHAHFPWLSQLLPIIIGWITLALVNAGLAQGKNRRGPVWFLVSLVLGPIATLAVVLVSKRQRRLF